MNELIQTLAPVIKEVAEATKQWTSNEQNMQKVSETIKTVITILSFLKDAIALIVTAWHTFGQMI